MADSNGTAVPPADPSAHPKRRVAVSASLRSLGASAVRRSGTFNAASAPGPELPFAATHSRDYIPPVLPLLLAGSAAARSHPSHDLPQTFTVGLVEGGVFCGIVFAAFLTKMRLRWLPGGERAAEPFTAWHVVYFLVFSGSSVVRVGLARLGLADPAPSDQWGLVAAGLAWAAFVMLLALHDRARRVRPA